jgi:hypothetical protein
MKPITPNRRSLPLILLFFLFILHSSLASAQRTDAFLSHADFSVARGPAADVQTLQIRSDSDPEQNMQVKLVKVESADGASSSSQPQAATPDATPEKNNPFVLPDKTVDRRSRRIAFVRYLVASGLMLGGIILAVPPIYYLATGQDCTKYPDSSRRCSERLRPPAWYDYAGLAFGGLMVGAGVAVLLWPTPGPSGQHGATVSVAGRF